MHSYSLSIVCVCACSLYECLVINEAQPLYNVRPLPTCMNIRWTDVEEMFGVHYNTLT